MSLRHWTGAFMGAALLALATACGASGPGGPDSGDTAGTQAAQTTDSNPATEGMGTEAPRSSERSGSIQLAGLPIGGGNDERGKDDCVGVSLLSSDVPEGAAVVVGQVDAGPGNVVTTAGGSCDSAPPCASYTFTSQANACSVAITWQKPGDDGWLAMRGTVACTGDQSACDLFRSGLTEQPITLTNPLAGESTTTGTTGSSPATPETTTAETTTTSTTSG
ncbi:hypothetical protein [Amycolatopsis sp. FDAARGOS 1241]|uniref:hypothetical protein n=1 Tax=Amycolatopsis sp. FDAARGOS 1241 TaxID=2778070 RepID=UPI0019517A02|nr:hypothetical protein [Amycolatopsis sp. FDAARGOS 1241]QRP43302.1 hypothetical protein I6J71_28255 [Amycolatopsis sp. FDAARGOS 1241]